MLRAAFRAQNTSWMRKPKQNKSNKKKPKELLLAKSINFSSKQLCLAKHEHKLVLTSLCLVTYKPSEGKEPNPALQAPNTAKTLF